MASTKIPVILPDSPFIAALRAGLDAGRGLGSQGQLLSNVADGVCDNAELLARLVNLCFWTSVALEEGRAVRGTVCICSRDAAPLARALKEPEPVSVKTLVALLTASPRSWLAVHAKENQLAFWGLLDASPQFALRLRVAGPGTVVASQGRTVLAVLQGEDIYIPPQRGGYIDWAVLVANALDRAKALPDRIKLAAWMLQIVTTMHRHGHGGAVVLVPSTSNAWKNDVNFKFSFDDSSSEALRRQLLELHEAERRHQAMGPRRTGERGGSFLPLEGPSPAAHRNLMDSIARSVGDLSAVDGAVVIDEELRVFGFGATLQAKPDDKCQVLNFDALDPGKKSETVSYMTLGGHRHTSAAQFVYQNHEAMVFVASHDGGLTLFAWIVDSAQVVAVRNLEHFAWEYSA